MPPKELALAQESLTLAGELVGRVTQDYVPWTCQLQLDCFGFWLWLAQPVCNLTLAWDKPEAETEHTDVE